MEACRAEPAQPKGGGGGGGVGASRCGACWRGEAVERRQRAAMNVHGRVCVCVGGDGTEAGGHAGEARVGDGNGPATRVQVARKGPHEHHKPAALPTPSVLPQLPTPSSEDTLCSASIADTLGSASIADTLGSASIADNLGSASIADILSSASIADTLSSASIADILSSASIADTLGSASIADALSSASIADILGSASIADTLNSASIADALSSASIARFARAGGAALKLKPRYSAPPPVLPRRPGLPTCTAPPLCAAHLYLLMALCCPSVPPLRPRAPACATSPPLPVRTAALPRLPTCIAARYAATLLAGRRSSVRSTTLSAAGTVMLK
eukprot:358677-Chlamydomonas_euryale.AAC.4